MLVQGLIVMKQLNTDETATSVNQREALSVIYSISNTTNKKTLNK